MRWVYRPTLVHGGHRFVRLAAGLQYACGITQAGESYCWGWNKQGNLGTGDTVDRLAPALVRGNHQFVDIAISATHTCAWTQAGRAYCWGIGTSGELGQGARASSYVPVQVGGPQP
jgi:alpha-tubulin suppressor-like RCC1 family protein